METPYKCSLSKEALVKAVKELNEPEDDEARLDAIKMLRDSFKTEYPNLKLLREDDSFILRFLRAKKFDQKKALQVLTNYHNRRDEWPEVFDKIRNPVLLRDVLDKGVVFPLEGRAKDGSRIVVMRPGFKECNVLSDMFATTLLTVDHLLDDEKTQVYGVTFIQDQAYLNTELVKQMSPLVAKRFSSTMQECMPLRIKQINMTNEPKLLDVLLAVVYPFFKAKIKRRLVLHGTDFSKLYESIEKSVLPFMFAGSGQDADISAWTSTLLSEGTAL